MSGDDKIDFDEINSLIGGTVSEPEPAADPEPTPDEIVDDVDSDDVDLDPGDPNPDPEPAPDDEITSLKSEIADLKEMLTGIANGQQPPNNVSTDEQNIEAPVMEDLQDMDFFADVDFEDLRHDESTFRSWFDASIKKVREADRDAIMATVYKNIPAIIQKHVVEQVEGKASAEQFYVTNKDLANNKQDVAKMANFVKTNYPNLAREEFFTKVADLTRVQIGAVAQVKNDPAEKPGKTKKPALNNKSVKAVAKRKPSAEPDGLEQEINDLINLF